MDYENFFEERLDTLRSEGRYREFADLERVVGRFPEALRHKPDGTVQDVTIWCSNDYLGMGHHPKVIEDAGRAMGAMGAGAGGTRNISGTTHYHVLLEETLAAWHGKEAALVMTSGYVANWTTLSTLASQIPDCVIFSDAENHNSMIEGIRHSRVPKHVFRHSDPAHLDELLAQYPKEQPKLVAFESVYSMDGDIAPLEAILDVCEKHNAMSFLDEVHAVGMYGPTGAGVAERDSLAERVTVIQGTMGKAIGLIGGYIAGSAKLVDFVRSFGPGFIFTTSLPPCVTAGALSSVEILRDTPDLRERHQERVATVKARLAHAGIPTLNTMSHIIPVMVRDAALCKQASDMLLNEHRIYVQPINYPTVPRGKERLRITPNPEHTEAQIDHLVESLSAVFQALGLARAAA